MYQNDAQKVLTGECRLSYEHLTAPHASAQNAEPKYSVALLIPKTDAATKADIDSAVNAAVQAGIPKTWGGQRPAKVLIPVHDGDGIKDNGEPYGEECRGCWVLSASSKTKPQVVHISNIRAELAPSDIYSGMYGRVTIRFFAYNNTGKRGIGCGLGNVLKTRDGEALGGGRSDAADDFAGLENPTAGAQEYPGAAAQPGYMDSLAGQAYPQQPQQQYHTQPVYPQPQQYPAYAPQPGYPQINPVTGLPM